MFPTVSWALLRSPTKYSHRRELLINSNSRHIEMTTLASTCATLRVLKLAMAVVVLASVLAVARPNQGAVSVPLLDDVADAVSAAIARADHQSTCTTIRVTRYTYRGYPYQTSVTTCTPIPHPPPREPVNVGEGAKASAYAAAAAGTAAVGCWLCSAVITGLGIADAFIPDSWADRNPTCNPAQTGIANCAR